MLWVQAVMLCMLCMLWCGVHTLHSPYARQETLQVLFPPAADMALMYCTAMSAACICVVLVLSTLFIKTLHAVLLLLPAMLL